MQISTFDLIIFERIREYLVLLALWGGTKTISNKTRFPGNENSITQKPKSQYILILNFDPFIISERMGEYLVLLALSEHDRVQAIAWNDVV